MSTFSTQHVIKMNLRQAWFSDSHNLDRKAYKQVITVQHGQYANRNMYMLLCYQMRE